ncbi:hypothetical protein ABEB36_004549 [Hypothenemus hampei]|uniref:Uncharacterized protein n=1 Tax=Hypothenemus hampei TaxID=57062 RepID=A0ABD1F3R5_HYPHA
MKNTKSSRGVGDEYALWKVGAPGKKKIHDPNIPITKLDPWRRAVLAAAMEEQLLGLSVGLTRGRCRKGGGLYG